MVILSDSDTVGGTEHSLRHLVASLDPRFEVVVAGTSPEVCALITAGRPSARTLALPVVRRKTDLVALARTVRRLAALRPAVFHINRTSPRSSRYLLAAAAALPGVRLVVVDHLSTGADTGLHRRLSAVLEHFVSAHVAVGRAAAAEAEARRGWPPGRVAAIPNGVPDIDLPPRSGAGPVVGCHGRLVAQKGLDVLLRAVAPLDCQVLLVGDGPERSRLEALGRQLGMGERLRVTGWQPDPTAWLSELDVFVMPSRFEGLPLALIEAMLAGRAIVATAVGSIGDAVVDDVSGLLVAPDDVDGLRRAVAGLLADPAQRTRLGRAARQTALREFTATRMAASYEDLYDRVAS